MPSDVLLVEDHRIVRDGVRAMLERAEDFRVVAGGVHVAPSAPFGWIEGPPGPNRLLGLYWLDALAYPGRSGIDLGERAHDFYQLFYAVALTPDGLRSLLGGTAP